MKSFKSFIFIISLILFSNTFSFASISPYITKSNQITKSLYKIQNYNSAIPESVLVLNSLDPNYNTNGQTPLNSILSSSALLAVDIATLRVSSGVLGVSSSVSDGYRAGVGDSINPNLIDELVNKGTKVTPENVIAATHSANGQIIFLETGKSGTKASGLIYIVERHKNGFANISVSEAQIPKVVMQAVNENKVVGTIGSSTNTRNIYEISINGVTKKIVIGIGDNGYIVTVHPY